MAPAANWASWADASEMVDQRLPGVANRVVNRLADEEPAGLSGRIAWRCETVGQTWVRWSARVARIEVRSATRGLLRRAWRVATWLAILCFLFF